VGRSGAAPRLPRMVSMAEPVLSICISLDSCAHGGQRHSAVLYQTGLATGLSTVPAFLPPG
jgi:hypothetical protein